MFSIATPSSWITSMPLARRNPPSRITSFRSRPRIVRNGVLTTTASSYTPGEIRTMPPGSARSTAAWIVGASWGTRTSPPGSAGGCSRPGPTSPPGASSPPTRAEAREVVIATSSGNARRMQARTGRRIAREASTGSHADRGAVPLSAHADRTPDRARRVVPVPGAAGDAHARRRAVRTRPVDAAGRAPAVRRRRARVRVQAPHGAPAQAEGEDGPVRPGPAGLGRRRRLRSGLPPAPRRPSEPGGPRRALRASSTDPFAPAGPLQAAVGALRDRGPGGRSRRDPDEGPSRDDRRALGHAPDGRAVRPVARGPRGAPRTRMGAGARTRAVIAAAPRGRHPDGLQAPGEGPDERPGRDPAIARTGGAGPELGLVGVPQHPRHGRASALGAGRADRAEPPVRDRRRAATAVQGDQGRARWDGQRRRAHRRGRRDAPPAPRPEGADTRPDAA